MKCPPTFVRASNLLSSSSLEGCRSTWQDHRHVRQTSGIYMSQHTVQANGMNTAAEPVTFALPGPCSVGVISASWHQRPHS